MDMIKKIAFTAATMLFVLAQIFSFYVIFVSQKEKIELLKEKERKDFLRNLSEFEREIQRADSSDTAEIEDHVIVWYFRENMSENSALYRGEKELFNNSLFEFEIENVEAGKEQSVYGCNCKEEKIENKSLLVFYYEYRNWYGEKQSQPYLFFYVVDITSIYEESWKLAVQEILISIGASLGMALLLVYLIRKITRPLQAVNEAQRQLIGSMSHELKTPLTAIRGYSETLLEVKLSEEQEEKALNYIHRESGRLSRLSEKMMELTKLYEPECKITLQEVSVEKLFASVEENVGYLLEEKKIELVREGSYQNKKKYLDEDLAVSFLINLINNSIMASESGGHIYLGADENSLWVRDEGCGIPSEEVDKVRKAFYRVDKSRSRKSGNMGLGLALCDQIAKIHHGTMKIESRLGNGTKISWIEEKEDFKTKSLI